MESEQPLQMVASVSGQNEVAHRVHPQTQHIVKLSLENIRANGNWQQNVRTGETNTIHQKIVAHFHDLFQESCTSNTCSKYWWIARFTCWIWNVSESTKDGGEKFCIRFRSISDLFLNCRSINVQLFSRSSLPLIPQSAKIYGFSKISFQISTLCTYQDTGSLYSISSGNIKLTLFDKFVMNHSTTFHLCKVDFWVVKT